jgi:hypothetical protein
VDGIAVPERLQRCHTVSSRDGQARDRAARTALGPVDSSR